MYLNLEFLTLEKTKLVWKPSRLIAFVFHKVLFLVPILPSHCQYSGIPVPHLRLVFLCWVVFGGFWQLTSSRGVGFTEFGVTCANRNQPISFSVIVLPVAAYVHCYFLHLESLGFCSVLFYPAGKEVLLEEKESAETACCICFAIKWDPIWSITWKFWVPARLVLVFWIWSHRSYRELLEF